MALNREQKRALKKRGELAEDGTQKATPRQAGASRPVNEPRPTARQFVHEVRAELRKVAWPSRSEVINYSIVVFITLVILTTIVGFLDWGLGSALLRLFER